MNTKIAERSALVVATAMMLAGCSGAAMAADDAGHDAPVAHDAGHDAGHDASPPPDDAGHDAAPAMDARAVDGPCVPLTAAAACAGKDCGYAGDGCRSGYGCGADGGAGACNAGQACGLLAPNVCGGCQAVADAGAFACQNNFHGGNPFTDCPIVATEAGLARFAPPGCTVDAVNAAWLCCPQP